MSDILATLRAEANFNIGDDMAATGLPAVQQLLHRAADEIERLNKWADGMTDTMLRERKAADALIKELQSRAATAEKELELCRAVTTLCCEKKAQVTEEAPTPMPVSRYEVMHNGEHMPRPDGEWVTYDDYAALENLYQQFAASSPSKPEGK